MAKNKKRQRRERVEPRMGEGNRPGSLNPRLTNSDKPSGQSRKASGKSTSRRKASTGKSRTRAGRRTKTAPRRRDFSIWRLARDLSIWRLARGGFYWCAVASVWGAIAIVGVLAYSAARLPQTSEWIIPDRPPNVKILDANGDLLANRGDTGGEAVRLEQLPSHVLEAVMAIEDRRFRHHFGIDPIGLARAMVTNVAAGRIVQGGSTLTQQLAKNLFLKPDRTMERKLQEVVLALWLEANHSKDEILEMYLNRVYFGAGAYGIDAAARRYFGKSARFLTLEESAMIAGLLKAPSRYAPTRNPELARQRAATVLSAMQRQGYLTRSEAKVALNQPSSVIDHYTSASEHYVADWVMSQLDTYVGALSEDIVVKTTIDRSLQQQAERSLRAHLSEHGHKRNVSQGAVVVLDRDGAVRALVGGRDYGASPFNRAVDAKRQPGSAFKPVVYLAAVERGLLPDDLRIDRPVSLRGWRPDNHTNDYQGPVTLRTALARSINTVATQLVGEVGAQRVVKTAQRLGISSPLTANPSIALGTSEVTPLELAQAYVPFSNGGQKVKPEIVQSIQTASGKSIHKQQRAKGEIVIGRSELIRMNDMLGAVIAYGSGKRASLDGRPAGGKTGTSQQFRDAWFAGYTAHFTGVVWMGNDDNSPMEKVTGGSLPAEIWQEIMTHAHDGVAAKRLPGNNQSVYAAAAYELLPVPRPRGTAQPGNDLVSEWPTRRPPDRIAAPANPAKAPVDDEKPDPVGRFIKGLFGG